MDVIPPDSNTFESGDEFTFNITADIADDFPSYLAGDTVTLVYVGTYTTTGPNGFTSVILADENDLNVGFFFSPKDAATTNAALPNVVDATDDEFDGGSFTPCFAAGTLIATPTGETAVEALGIGDLVLTQQGKTVAVKWIGRKTVLTAFPPAEHLMLVRIKAGVLGGGIPHTDLIVTSDHALLIDGLLINAGALVNGTTITSVPRGAFGNKYVVYHVETENHDVILANGAAAETYVDYIQRRIFDNYWEYLALYGQDRTVQEMDLNRVSSARLVPPAIRKRLSAVQVA
ncbi:MAG: hypothetical protein GJ676_03920 [Rhodobacteraceae bacterium]|nr:hypothetical protein [Paracoccaceae bacterium]